MTDDGLFTQPARPPKPPFDLALVVYGDGWGGHLTFALRIASGVHVLVATDLQRSAAQEQIDRAGCRDEVDIRVEEDGPARYLAKAGRLDVVVTSPSNFEYFDTVNERWAGKPREGFNILLVPDSTDVEAKVSLESAAQPFQLASIGGTFNRFHEGHARYVELALRLAARIHVFIAADDYAKSRKDYRPKRLSDRSQRFRNHLRRIGAFERAEIEPLRHADDIGKYVAGTKELDLVLAERVYVPWFIQWNRDRTDCGLEPFAIMCKPRATHYGQVLASSLWADQDESSPVGENAVLFEEV